MGGTGPNLEMAMKAAQLAIIQAHHVSGQASNSSVPQPGSGSIPSNQASVSIGQNQQVCVCVCVCVCVGVWVCVCVGVCRFYYNYFT